MVLEALVLQDSLWEYISEQKYSLGSLLKEMPNTIPMLDNHFVIIQELCTSQSHSIFPIYCVVYGAQDHLSW